jgi:hypothetical protein
MIRAGRHLLSRNKSAWHTLRLVRSRSQEDRMGEPEQHFAEKLRERIREVAPNDRGERAGLQLVRMAIEMTCPAGVLPSEEAVLGLYGPEPIHEGEALAKAIIETVERLTRYPDEATPRH